MNSKSTWNWILVALALSAFIFFFEKYVRKPAPGPMRLLPQLDAARATSVQVFPAGKLEIRANRTNGTWQLSQPVVYPARTNAIEALLDVLQHIGPASYISARELRQRPKFDEEYGFTSPQLSLIIQEGEEHSQILFGKDTAPGDQVFVQVVGADGIYVVDARLLAIIPSSADQWRDTALADLRGQGFDRITITNGIKVIELRFNGANGLWTMTRPIQARADKNFISGLLEDLAGFNAMQFIADGPNSDLESFGLQPPALSLTLARDTNAVFHMDFGKSSTNINDLVYARRGDYDSIVTVSNEWLAPWRADVNDFRDHHLVTLTSPVSRIEIKGENGYVLESQSSNNWKIVGEDFPVDAGLASNFVQTLTTMPIMEFKDAVTESDLPAYGLTNPVRRLVIETGQGGPPVELSFGAVQGDEIHARRADEGSVYLVKLGDYQQLPSAGWQLRERRLWHFTEEEVARVTFHQGGGTRVLVRNGTNSWSLAPGSQGFVNEEAVEEVSHRFGELVSTLWTARGYADAAHYGLATNQFSIEFELKNGEKRDVEFGDMAPSQYPYASVKLDGEPWIFEFPLALYHFATNYLAIPAGTP